MDDLLATFATVTASIFFICVSIAVIHHEFFMENLAPEYDNLIVQIDSK